MNTFAGNITLIGNTDISSDFEFDYLESLSQNGDKNLYIFGETDFTSSEELIDFFNKSIGELRNYDISISTEDKIELIPYDFEEGVYEVVSFEGEQVSFEEIKDRFLEHDAMFSVREAEESDRYGNRVVRVDFIY